MKKTVFTTSSYNYLIKDFNYIPGTWLATWRLHNHIAQHRPGNKSTIRFRQDQYRWIALSIVSSLHSTLELLKSQRPSITIYGAPFHLNPHTSTTHWSDAVVAILSPRRTFNTRTLAETTCQDTYSCTQKGIWKAKDRCPESGVWSRKSR